MERSTDKEYELLRAEIAEWQNRRFALIGMSVTVVAALIGFSQFASARLTWDVISSMLFFFLSVACALSEYCGLANIKIGTYLQTFHEDHKSNFNWENRNHMFSKVGPKSGSLNEYLCAVYLVLAAFSFIAPLHMFSPPKDRERGLTTVLFTSVLFLIFLYRLYRSQSRRQKFLDGWAAVKVKINKPSSVSKIR